jgi:cleavage stimulation factor subunit 3
VQGINPIIAKKMQEDRLRDYLNSKRATKEYETFTKGLNKNSPAVPPQNTVAEAKQVGLVLPQSVLSKSCYR